MVRQTCDAFEIRILKGVVSADHIHILVSAPPEMAPSEIMRRIKGRTASKLFEEFPALKKRYWGRHFWARGYFCATVGELSEEMIKQYLEHHFEPDPAAEFRVEP
ncbi:transposase IS200-family protein [Thiorhodococcus drewsii AZ1]|uniref:Transposase IS200-family protein n=1 Tax=Thiorhodococcus drewsii AZ1 TaxID=765913 RepID=G2E8U9_9GAMM|nr:transposase IS200-family protein [Thiorhodococcus drewsii AZ1]